MYWDELRKDLVAFIKSKAKILQIEVKSDISFIENAPIDGEYVYGEAFPEENRIWIQIVAPYASDNEIYKTICHELIHLKFPDLNHNSRKFIKYISEINI